MIKSINTPTFILNSDYDSWQVISIFKFLSTCQKFKIPDCCFSPDTKCSCAKWILSWTGMVQLQSRYSELQFHTNGYTAWLAQLANIFDANLVVMLFL